MTAERSTTSATIRPYREVDRGAVIALARELQAHERALFSRMRPTSDIDEGYVDGLLDDCKRDGGMIIVAEIAGALVGYAVVNTAVPAIRRRRRAWFRLVLLQRAISSSRNLHSSSMVPSAVAGC